VDYELLMKINHCAQQLLHYFSCSFFGIIVIFSDAFKQITAVTVLSEKVVIVFPIIDFKQLYNIRVV
jgi:hypothetical protein